MDVEGQETAQISCDLDPRFKLAIESSSIVEHFVAVESGGESRKGEAGRRSGLERLSLHLDLQ